MKTKTIFFVSIVVLTILVSSNKVNGQETKPIINGTISTGIFSHYVAPMGYVLGKGPHNQTCVELNMKGFKLFGWSDYDFKAKSMIELDLGLRYTKKIKYTSMSAGLTYWNYPAGGEDDIAYIILEHDKKITKELFLGYLIKDKDNETGFWIKSRISKKFNHKYGFSSDLGITAAYVFNFYGDTGFSDITPGANINWKVGNINLTGSLNYQFGFIKEPVKLPPVKNQLYESLNFSVSF